MREAAAAKSGPGDAGELGVAALAAATINRTIDAGIVTSVSIGDFVWFDTDRDGVQDSGESPVEGVVVNLIDPGDGSVVATTTTDADGFYSFTGLIPSTEYTVEFVAPSGSSFTGVDAGGDDGADSDADPVSGRVSVTTPANGLNSATAPDDPTIDGYIHGWKTSTPYTFGTFFLNTLWIVLPKIIGTAISCTAVAYGFARFDFPFKKLLFATLIATLLLPNVVTRIPQYLLFRDLGWLDTYLPLWVPSAFAGDAFFVFMLVQFLRAIPRDMEEAARVDGANTWQVLVFIVIPLLMPALISVCLFQFMWTMNDFLGPLIYISSVDKFPVSLALKLSIDTTEAFEWNRVLAMSVLTLLPALTVFFLAQKYFIDGISAGGIKG